MSNFGGFEFVPKKTEPNSVPIFGQAPEKTSASTGYGTYMQTIIMKDLKTELCNQSFNNRITSADKISFKMLLKHLFTTFLLASGLRSKKPVDQRLPLFFYQPLVACFITKVGNKLLVVGTFSFPHAIQPKLI